MQVKLHSDPFVGVLQIKGVRARLVLFNGPRRIQLRVALAACATHRDVLGLFFSVPRPPRCFGRLIEGRFSGTQHQAVACFIKLAKDVGRMADQAEAVDEYEAELRRLAWEGQHL